MFMKQQLKYNCKLNTIQIYVYEISFKLKYIIYIYQISYFLYVNINIQKKNVIRTWNNFKC